MIKCDKCGKPISWYNILNRVNVHYVFIPDSKFTVEESYWEHAICPCKVKKGM